MPEDFKNKKPCVSSPFGWGLDGGSQRIHRAKKLESLFQTGLMKIKISCLDEFPLQPFETSFQKMVLCQRNAFFLLLFRMNRISFRWFIRHGPITPSNS
jgi:hypothetical protein